MIVIDCSIVMAFSLPDENNNRADDILKRLSQDKLQAFVPAIFYTECSNVLLSAYRRKRINTEQWQDYLDTIALLPIDVDQYSSSADGMLNLSTLSENYDLTIYDAAYLELALRKKVPLMTLDKKLNQSALNASVAVL